MAGGATGTFSLYNRVMGISYKFRMKASEWTEGPEGQTYLQWREPRMVQTERVSAQGAGRRRLMVLAFAASITFVGMMGMKVPDAMPRMLAALAIVFGMLLLILWAYRRRPMYIWITGTYIGHDITHNKPSRSYFKDIDHCEIADATFYDETHPMLAIHSKRGDQTAYGIEPGVDIGQLTSLLEGLGVRVDVTGRQLSDPFSS